MTQTMDIDKILSLNTKSCQFEIFGEQWKIRFGANFIDRDGNCNSVKRVIDIYDAVFIPELSPEYFWQLICHEIVHAYLITIGQSHLDSSKITIGEMCDYSFKMNQACQAGMASIEKLINS